MANTSQLARSSGVIRPITAAFLAHKKTYRGDKSPGLAQSPESGRILLLTGVPLSDIPSESKEIPVLWLETYEKVNNRLKEIETKLDQLKKIQQERIQTSFGDLRSQDRQIALLTSQITSVCLPQK